MKPIAPHSAAEDEIADAELYYNRQRDGLGAEFRQELEAALGRIGKNPKLFSIFRNTQIRKCRLNRFPFTIFFQEFDEYIWIAAVAHQKRREGYWLDRSQQDG